MNEQSDSLFFVPSGYRSFLADAGVSGAQLADYLKNHAGFSLLVDDYVNAIGSGFTPDDMILMQKLRFPLQEYQMSRLRGRDGNGHEYLWQWIERHYKKRQADKAGMALNEFVGVWSELPEYASAKERSDILDEYIHARRTTDIPVRTLRQIVREMPASPFGIHGHSLKISYVPLTRLCWTHEQIMDILHIVESPEHIEYVCEVARKGLWYEEIYTWLDEGLSIRDLALKLRISNLQSNDAKELVAFLMRYIQENTIDLSIGRTLGEIHQHLHEALIAYHDDRALEGLSHEQAMSKAVDAFHPVP